MIFFSYNNIPILDDFGVEDKHGSGHRSDLDDIDEKVELEVVDSMGRIVGVLVSKVLCKYCQTKLVWQKGMETTHPN